MKKPKKDHEELVEKALTAIRNVHGDTGVSPAETLESLEQLREEISFLINALREETA